mmetsp:Transcript_19430/g.46339  ORF Transcript_19430/g.46339 Transcript_19430/m.46339 type:complete len:201 (-) Transcript_19430:3087-3689(-)
MAGLVAGLLGSVKRVRAASIACKSAGDRRRCRGRRLISSCMILGSRRRHPGRVSLLEPCGKRRQPFSRSLQFGEDGGLPRCWMILCRRGIACDLLVPFCLIGADWAQAVSARAAPLCCLDRASPSPVLPELPWCPGGRLLSLRARLVTLATASLFGWCRPQQRHGAGLCFRFCCCCCCAAAAACGLTGSLASGEPHRRIR